ncbi:hypothetical protein [Pectinatus frisingensis]|uniref:hypothetical protein n=1 Tax=Pectinatus frisingensis TaxID=865 RepID=UPI003D8008F9
MSGEITTTKSDWVKVRNSAEVTFLKTVDAATDDAVVALAAKSYVYLIKLLAKL